MTSTVSIFGIALCRGNFEGMGFRMGTVHVACVAALFVVSAHGTFDIIEKGIQQVLCDIPGKVITSATPSVWPLQLPRHVSALCGCNLGLL